MIEQQPPIRPLPETAPGLEQQSERQLKAVLADLFEHSETLVRQEVELGKAELNTRVEAGKAALIRGAIAGGLYLAAYHTALATVVLLLALWVTPWLAALIVCVLASSGAVLFTRLGQKALTQVRSPEQQRTFTHHGVHS